LRSSAEGVPLLVEELLAAWVGSGALVREQGDWAVRRYVAPVVPLTFADSVRRRFEGLDAAGKQLLQAAALLGRRFDWTLLPPGTGIEESVIAAALRRAVEAQLLAADERGFRFRHTLTHDVVLAGILPPERIALARRALDALEAADGEREELAARLAEAAGERGRAAALLLVAARRGRAAGALATAAATLDRAAALATGDCALAAEVDEELTEVLALRGETERAAAIGEALLATLDRVHVPAARRGRILLGLVRAALLSGCLDTATARVEQARHLAEEAGDDELRVRVTALAAHVALARGLRATGSGGDGYTESREPVALANEALAAAERIGLPEVACEALEVIGRTARMGCLKTAEGAFQQALEIAERHGLVLWRVRALHELGTIDLIRAHHPDRLAAARAAALEAGALATATVIDLQLAKVYAARYELDECLAAAARCSAAARRYGLDTLAQAIGTEAVVHALRGHEDRMEACIAEALAHGGDDPDVQAYVLGHGRAYLSLVQEDLDRARDELDRAMAHTRRAPGSPPRPFRGLWALLHAVADDGGEAALAELRSTGAVINHGVACYAGFAEAVLLGRAGRRRDAENAFGRADAEMRELLWYRHHAHRLVAGAAIADGWGDPVAWLREALEFFVAADAPRIASACRSLLRKAGAPVPRRARGKGAVPAPLRALGVTGREMEVLALVAEGLSNADIGERLFLSPRTVERHVSSLLARTGARGRTELVTVAHAAAGDPAAAEPPPDPR
ncbi:MAG TPA: LuxR C-terminal-related transcriptional regulator, partial [Actinomycetes bacterium]|nr:LuxR C-terminal-related transcriptional regulator [Actinomycetes bacterium]